MLNPGTNPGTVYLIKSNPEYEKNNKSLTSRLRTDALKTARVSVPVLLAYEKAISLNPEYVNS